MRRPALQRRIIQALRSDIGSNQPIMIPIFIRFLSADINLPPRRTGFPMASAHINRFDSRSSSSTPTTTTVQSHYADNAVHGPGSVAFVPGIPFSFATSSHRGPRFATAVQKTPNDRCSRNKTLNVALAVGANIYGNNLVIDPTHVFGIDKNTAASVSIYTAESCFGLTSGDGSEEDKKNNETSDKDFLDGFCVVVKDSDCDAVVSLIATNVLHTSALEGSDPFSIIARTDNCDPISDCNPLDSNDSTDCMLMGCTSRLNLSVIGALCGGAGTEIAGRVIGNLGLRGHQATGKIPKTVTPSGMENASINIMHGSTSGFSDRDNAREGVTISYSQGPVTSQPGGDDNRKLSPHVPHESLDADGIVTNRPIMKRVAFVVVDAAQAIQSTTTKMNRNSYLFNVCDYGTGNKDDSGNGNNALQSGTKDTNGHCVATHNNGVITASPTHVMVDTQHAFSFTLRHHAGHTPTFDCMPLTEPTTVNSFVTLNPSAYVATQTYRQVYPGKVTDYHPLATTTDNRIKVAGRVNKTATLANNFTGCDRIIRRSVTKLPPVDCKECFSFSDTPTFLVWCLLSAQLVTSNPLCRCTRDTSLGITLQASATCLIDNDSADRNEHFVSAMPAALVSKWLPILLRYQPVDRGRHLLQAMLFAPLSRLHSKFFVLIHALGFDHSMPSPNNARNGGVYVRA